MPVGFYRDIAGKQERVDWISSKLNNSAKGCIKVLRISLTSEQQLNHYDFRTWTYAFVRETASAASGKALCLLLSEGAAWSLLGMGRSGVDRCAAMRFCGTEIGFGIKNFGN